jgi:hypothetical protein
LYIHFTYGVNCHKAITRYASYDDILSKSSVQLGVRADAENPSIWSPSATTLTINRLEMKAAEKYDPSEDNKTIKDSSQVIQSR